MSKICTSFHGGQTHVCKCLGCQPEAFPAEMFRETRATDAHRGVRFMDIPRDINVMPYLNGVKVEDVIEGIAGADSWLVVHSKDASGRTHRCANCLMSTCKTVLYGDVVFTSLEATAAHAPSR